MGDMVSALWHGAEPDPPFYYLLQNLWVQLFGVGPLALRSLSILFFLAALVFMRRAGQTWFDPATGLAAMLVCAVHPAHLFLGFAGRWYSLMFLLAAVLLWLTARASAPAGVRRGWLAAWALVAAGLCYTNYFGIVVAGLLWIVGAVRGRRRQLLARWVWAAVGTLALYAVWLPPLWRTMTTFPGGGVSWMSYAATMARTAVALLAGDLAAPQAWWVWVPLGVFGISVLVLLANQWREVRPLAFVALGCLVAGVASRTMIGKYIMTFSGAACLLLAVLVVRALRTPGSRDVRVAVRVALVSLAVGWLGCGVNLVTQRHWSSLRWLDPVEEAIRDLMERKDVPPPAHWVMTHPSARYYYACLSLEQAARATTDSAARVDARGWRRRAEAPSLKLGNFEVACGTPESVLDLMSDAPVSALVTLETAGFRELADDWGELHDVLRRTFEVADCRRYLEDPQAEWKDRLDPTFRHPRWRIVLQHWVFRGEEAMP
jgi:hypothetical protein